MPPMSPEEQKAFDDMKAERDSMKAEKDKAAAEAAEKAKKEKEGKKSEDDLENDTLREKARKERESQEKMHSETRRVESALGFNMGLPDFLKDNADVLPSEITTIISLAEKETYDSKIEKAAAIKKSLFEAFFAVQANVDLLTKGQKATLDDYFKLTKNGKEQKAEFVYENLFEPALETLKKVKKAEEIGKARTGHATGNKVDDAYKAKLVAGSRKTYLGEKG